jgi:hypothetical protein
MDQVALLVVWGVEVRAVDRKVVGLGLEPTIHRVSSASANVVLSNRNTPHAWEWEGRRGG